MTSNVSIGKIGELYYDRMSVRAKGFLTKIHNTLPEIQETLDRAIPPGVDFGTRLTVRVLVKGITPLEVSLFRFYTNDGLLLFEGYVPVHNVAGVDFIVYLGWNAKYRRTCPETVIEEQKFLTEVQGANTVKTRQLPTGCTKELWAPGVISNHTKDIHDLITIYHKSFSKYLVEFDEVSIHDMIESNYTCVVRCGGNIASVGMAEVATLETSAGTFRIAELSEIATHPDYHGRKLAFHVVQGLMEEVTSLGIEAIFSEARANHPPILAVMHNNGLHPSGFLMQHCLLTSPFKSVEQPSIFGDLFVLSV